MPHIRCKPAHMAIPIPVDGRLSPIKSRITPDMRRVDQASVAYQQLIALLRLIAIVALTIETSFPI
jgi:hypothetical protein